MTTLAGKGLLFGGCVALGILTGLGRLRRVACLADFRRSLSSLARELTFSLRPLPELAEEAAGSGPAGECLRACRRCFLASGGESWAESWGTVLQEADLPLSDEDRGLLAEFGQVLGRYDGESQQRALQALLDRLGEQVETARQTARQTARRLVRVDVTLGVTAGLFCLILL